MKDLLGKIMEQGEGVSQAFFQDLNDAASALQFAKERAEVLKLSEVYVDLDKAIDAVALAGTTARKALGM